MTKIRGRRPLPPMEGYKGHVQLKKQNTAAECLPSNGDTTRKPHHVIRMDVLWKHGNGALVLRKDVLDAAQQSNS